MRRAALALLLLLAACDNSQTQRRRTDPPVVDAGCGNGVLDEGEACDGTDFGNHDCTTEGFEQGSLLCSDTCALVTTNCIKRCGNGVLDLGEQCDGDAGVPTCGTFGYGACSPTCTDDSSHCVQYPFAPGGGFTVAQGGGTFLVDLPGTSFGDLVTTVPNLFRLELYTWTTDKGLTADRKPGTNGNPLFPIGGQLDGVTGADLAVIDQDRMVERLRWVPGSSSFARDSLGVLSDAGTGCVPAPFVGAGKVDPDEVDDLVAYGCSQTSGRSNDFVVFKGGPAPVSRQIGAADGIITSTLADLDGDGRLEILYVSDAAPSELRGFKSTGSALVPLTALPLPMSPRFLAGADFDGDGDLDLVATDDISGRVLENTGGAFAARGDGLWGIMSGLGTADLDLDGHPDFYFFTGGGFTIARNTGLGDFTFTTFNQTTGAGKKLVSFSSGDVDNDGDPDLAVTFITDGGTATELLRNVVR